MDALCARYDVLEVGHRQEGNVQREKLYTSKYTHGVSCLALSRCTAFEKPFKLKTNQKRNICAIHRLTLLTKSHAPKSPRGESHNKCGSHFSEKPRERTSAAGDRGDESMGNAMARSGTKSQRPIDLCGTGGCRQTLGHQCRWMCCLRSGPVATTATPANVHTASEPAH